MTYLTLFASFSVKKCQLINEITGIPKLVFIPEAVYFTALLKCNSVSRPLLKPPGREKDLSDRDSEAHNKSISHYATNAVH